MSLPKDDKINCIGISELMKSDLDDDDAELEKLEIEIVSGVPIKQEINVEKQFSQQIDNYDKIYNSDSVYNSDDMDLSSFKSSPFDDDKISSTRASYGSTSPITSATSALSGFNFNDEFGADSSSSSSSSSSNKDEDDEDDAPQSMYISPPRTAEQIKQEHIKTVFQNVEKNGAETLIANAQLDDIDILLDQITDLRKTLQEDDVDISDVPFVNKGSDPSQIRDVHKTLLLKNDKSRYCSIAEELVLSLSSSLEDIFNGEREFFGQKPDLVGWSNTVKLKLKRMRYHTGSFVHGIMEKYGMTSNGWRLAAELIPSMFLYSRRRRVTKNDKLNVGRNNDLHDALSDLHDA
jgi:hypothetical protein